MGDTTWIMVSTVLVMFMFMPGLALFYGGLVGQRNILSIIMHSLSAFIIVTIVWVLWGYSIAFGPGIAEILEDSTLSALIMLDLTPKTA